MNDSKTVAECTEDRMAKMRAQVDTNPETQTDHRHEKYYGEVCWCGKRLDRASVARRARARARANRAGHKCVYLDKLVSGALWCLAKQANPNGRCVGCATFKARV